MFAKGQFRMLVLGLAGIGGAWWLLRQMQCAQTKSKGHINQGTNAPHWAGGRRKPQPDEYWLDDTIEASFPASDPSSSTPVLGTGRRNY
jgi:hypothetical protein